MRKSRKATIVIGSTVGALAIGGVAFAYWTTSGSGTGTGSTETGNTAAMSITGNAAAAMYPGDSAQTVTAVVKNTDEHQTLRVAGLTAYITTDAADCDGTDYLIDGSTSSSDAPVALDWSAQQIAAGQTASTTYEVQFNNKPADNQNACSGADVTVHYASN